MEEEESNENLFPHQEGSITPTHEKRPQFNPGAEEEPSILEDELCHSREAEVKGSNLLEDDLSSENESSEEEENETPKIRKPTSLTYAPEDLDHSFMLLYSLDLDNVSSYVPEKTGEELTPLKASSSTSPPKKTQRNQKKRIYRKHSNFQPTEKKGMGNNLDEDDSSSDEELEAKHNSESVISRILTTDVPEDMNISFMLLYLGIRFLISNDVRKTYYSLKREKLGKVANWPDDKQLRNCFTKGLKKCIFKKVEGNNQEKLKLFEMIQESYECHEYLQNIFDNKLLFLSSEWSNRIKFSREYETRFTELKNALIASVRIQVKDRDVTDYIESFRTNCKRDLRRPELGETYEFTIQENEYSPTKLFANLRLNHCSTKRYLKNTPKRGPADVVLKRKWNFGLKPSFSVQADVKVNKECMRVIDLSTYSYYVQMFQRLEDFKKPPLNMTNADIVSNIKSLLRTGALKNNNKRLRTFLPSFTFALFGREVERDPAALIRHMLALDLMINNEKFEAKSFLILRHHCEIGFVQGKLKDYLPIKYHFDYYDYQWYEKFWYGSPPARKEQELVMKWFEYKRNEEFRKEIFVEEVNELCKEYFGISLL